jgi:hypothetical protein
MPRTISAEGARAAPASVERAIFSDARLAVAALKLGAVPGAETRVRRVVRAGEPPHVRPGRDRGECDVRRGAADYSPPVAPRRARYGHRGLPRAGDRLPYRRTEGARNGTVRDADRRCCDRQTDPARSATRASRHPCRRASCGTTAHEDLRRGAVRGAAKDSSVISVGRAIEGQALPLVHQPGCAPRVKRAALRSEGPVLSWPPRGGRWQWRPRRSGASGCPCPGS